MKKTSPSHGSQGPAKPAKATLPHLAFLPGSQFLWVSGEGIAFSCLGPVQVLFPAAHSPSTLSPPCALLVPLTSPAQCLTQNDCQNSHWLLVSSPHPQPSSRGRSTLGPGAHCVGHVPPSSLPSSGEKAPLPGQSCNPGTRPEPPLSCRV